MADDVLVNKAAVIERCVARARQEYAANPAGFATDFTRQDAAILNIQRACEAALDIAVHDDQALQLPITVSIITDHLDEFLQFSQAVLLREGRGVPPG
jgi:hypothetical protein